MENLLTGVNRFGHGLTIIRLIHIRRHVLISCQHKYLLCTAPCNALHLSPGAICSSSGRTRQPRKWEDTVCSGESGGHHTQSGAEISKMSLQSPLQSHSRTLNRLFSWSFWAWLYLPGLTGICPSIDLSNPGWLEFNPAFGRNQAFIALRVPAGRAWIDDGGLRRVIHIGFLSTTKIFSPDRNHAPP